MQQSTRGDPLNEDAVTEALIAALEGAGPEATSRFLAEVVGVACQSDRFEYWGTPRKAWIPVDGPTLGLVVGLSVSGDLASNRWIQSGWGESKVDASISSEDLLVLFEVKVRRGALEGTQMVRHATVGALSVDPDLVPFTGDALPPGFALRTWADVGSWLAHELARPEHQPEIVELAATLSEQGICQPIGTATGPAAVLTAREPRPRPTALPGITAEWDFRRVREVCSRVFGHEPIKEGDCLEDTRRLVGAYTSTGKEETPLGLRFHGPDGAMTPLRVLSVLYGRTSDPQRWLSNAYPAAWTAFHDRTIGAGADRHVLVAMLAWAGGISANQTRKRIQANATIAWTDAPDKAPGLEELHRHLAPARRR